MGWFGITKKSELGRAIKKLSVDPSIENQKFFGRVLSSYVENGTWIHMPVRKDENGFRLKIIEHVGNHYVSMCSDESEIKKDSEFSIMMTDINKLLDSVFQSHYIDGIAINPYTNVLYMEKEYLIKCILHTKYPEQELAVDIPKDWGEGIPVYNQSDIMTASEIQSFALETIVENDSSIKNACEIVSISNWPDAMPSLILKSEDGFAFVYVKGYVAYAEPVLSENEKEKLVALGKKYCAETYFASVGFLSSDPARFEAELALKGDGFYCKYSGLQRVD